MHAHHGAAAFAGIIPCCLCLLITQEAHACGPCTDPLLLEIERGENGLVVVSNFGLLEQHDGGWRVTCEERIGGLLLDVDSDRGRTLASTDNGFYEQDGDLCEWEPGPTGATNDWFLSFSASATPAGASRVPYALVVDRETQDLVVERSDGDAMVVIGRFESAVGYRDIIAGGDPAAVFVAGYSYNPRTWNLGYSRDDGETWQTHAPAIDNEYSSAYLRLVDPERPQAVLVELETPVGQPDELWRFDATTGEAELLLTLEDGELLTGISLDGDDVWVAGSRRSGGSIYRASRNELAFTRVSDSAPITDCLTAVDGTLYVCVNDFTVRSEYVIGVSRDGGTSWNPYFTLEELGAVTSCGEDCAATEEWLVASYGARSDADAGTSNGEQTDGDKPSPTDAEGDSEGCTMSSPRSPWRGCYDSLGAILLVSLLQRRRRSVHSRKRTC